MANKKSYNVEIDGQQTRVTQADIIRVEDSAEQIEIVKSDIAHTDEELRALKVKREGQQSFLNWLVDMKQAQAQLEFPFNKDEMGRKYNKKSYL